MQKLILPYALAAIFAILSIATGFQSIKYQKLAKDAQGQVNRLKQEASKPVVKISEEKPKNGVTPPEPPQIQPQISQPESPRFSTAQRERPEPQQFWENMRSRFEEMKNTNPERYNEIMQRINEFTANAHKETLNRIEFFKSIPISEQYMTPEEMEKHNRLIEILEKNSKSMALLLENPESEDATQLRMELMQSTREISELLEAERKIAVKKLGIEYGLQGDKLKQFEEDLNKINSMTSLGFGRGGGFFPGGRRNSEQHFPR